MSFEDIKARLQEFLISDIYPNEAEFLKQCHDISKKGNEWTHPPILVTLQKKAKALGLWNLFFPVDSAQAANLPGYKGSDFTNKQYGTLCEMMGTSVPAEFAAQVTNCTSPDTGNMEVLARYGTMEQKQKWLLPLLEGNIRSAYCMTEPAVASSDATNIALTISKDEKTNEYVLNGRKWWITGAGSLHCTLLIVMGQTSSTGPIHKRQSQIIVPANTPGITLVRPMLAMGDDDSPKGHMEMIFSNVRVPASNIILGEGRGFEISQGRLGPGRIHHCMRAIGQGERALALMCKRVQNRTAFGKPLSKNDVILQQIALSRGELEQARLLVLEAADRMDKYGNKDLRTRQLLSLMKAIVPNTIQKIADRAIQAHGAMGLCQDTPLWMIWMGARMLRLADGPDEVHLMAAGRMEYWGQKSNPLSELGYYTDSVNKGEGGKVFRRSTDPISEEAKQNIARSML